MAAGIGKQVSARYSLSGLYGVVPTSISKGPFIETFTLRQTYSFTSNERFNFYGGLNVFHVTSIRYHSSRYGESPKNYYPIGQVRGLLYLGGSWALGPRKKTAFYLEGGMNDIWLTNWVTNEDQINPSEHVSLGLGFRYQFN